MTDVWDQYLFHYVSEGGLTFLVMADDSVGRRMPFAFLADLQRRVRHLDQDVFSKLIFFAWRVQQFTSAYSSNLIFDVPA